MRLMVVFMLIAAVAPSCGWSQVYVVDGNNEPIGFYLDTEYMSPVGGNPSSEQLEVLHVLSPTDYAFRIVKGFYLNSSGSTPNPYLGFYFSGGLGSIHFESPDCTGQGYVASRKAGYITIVQVNFNVFPGPTSEVWYVPKNAETQAIVVGSVKPVVASSGTCIPQGGIVAFVIPAFPNNPAETGVMGSFFEPPIRITSNISAARLNCIFRSSFECAIEN